MVKVIQIHETGGPEVLKLGDVALQKPAAGQVRLRQTAIGVNFIDTYQRSGLYKLESMPAILGMEGAGVVTAVGEGVPDFKIGDRVAYGTLPGGYAEERLALADRLVPLPASIADATAAAMMLRGMTVRYLFQDTYRCTANTVALFHAAAGGVGLIACQWARAIGMTLIGTTGSDEKAALARANGCTHVINYARENFVDRVKEITNGAGCDVVYDSVGKDTFPASLDCLKPRGLWVSFGNASGAVPPFDIGLLSAKGALYTTRPSLFWYTAAVADLRANAQDLFDMVSAGKVKIAVNHTYPLSEAASAHRDLEARRTTGSVILLLN